MVLKTDQIIKPEQVKLIIGLIAKADFLDQARLKLARTFGNIDYISEIFDFDTTRYYEEEMGINLKRQFIGFKNLINPELLSEIKVKTNKIETSIFSSHNKRQVNIDPGYLSISKLVLATTKDHQHRVYLKNGIFAEVTLRYRDKTFCGWPWTYVDYCKSEYIKTFNDMRSTLIKKRRRSGA